MSSKHLKNFLKALEIVKQDQTCVVCSQLCKNPGTLSKCFHMICSDHFEDLKTCPKCLISLDGCTVYKESSLDKCVEATRQLDKMFENFRKDTFTKSDLQSESFQAESLQFETPKSEPKRKRESKNKLKRDSPLKNKSDLNELIQPNECELRSGKETVNTSIPAMTLESDLQSENVQPESLHIETPKSEPRQKRESKKSLEKNSPPKNKSDLNESIQPDECELRSRKENVNTSVPVMTLKFGKNKQKPSKQSTMDHNNSLQSTFSTSTFKYTLKSIEKRNSKGETMLHVACRLGKADKVAELLKEGANTNTKDHAGWTPLHEVVQSGQLDLIKLLLQYNTLINVPGPSNETPLHEAVRYKHKEIVEELVRNGANINIRNCKGESPLELANNEMKLILEKAAESVVQTQSVNIRHIEALYTELDYENMRVYCISQYRTVHNNLKLLAKHHNNVHIEAKLSNKVTHLIVDTEDDGICTPNLDILQAIVSCIWILSTDWVTKYNGTNLEPFKKYEVKGIGTTTSNGPRNARYNKYKQLPGIFNGCHFYFHNFNMKHEISKSIILTKAILTKLVTDAGGIVLRRVPNPESIPDNEKLVPYHAKRDGKLAICSHYIIFKTIYEPMYNMQHIKALPIGWLIECIEKYELCEPW